MGNIEDGLNELGFLLQNSKQEQLSVGLTDAITEHVAGNLSYALLLEMATKEGVSVDVLEGHIAVAKQAVTDVEKFLNSREKDSSEFQKEKETFRDLFNGTLGGRKRD